jgi:hypothetical protein
LFFFFSGTLFLVIDFKIDRKFQFLTLKFNFFSISGYSLLSDADVHPLGLCTKTDPVSGEHQNHMVMSTDLLFVEIKKVLSFCLSVVFKRSKEYTKNYRFLNKTVKIDLLW